MSEMKDRRIAVVGGCGGLGRALVADLHSKGARVFVLDLPASIATHPVPEGVAALPVDATDPDAVKRAFATIGEAVPALDGMVNLAGFVGASCPLMEMPLPLWEEVVRGNLTAAFVTTQAAVPLLRKGDMPSIVHTSSGLTRTPRPGYAHYSAAKDGVNAFVRSAALELAPGIRVNSVAPGAVDTAFFRGGTGRSDESGTSDLDVERYVPTVPLKRMAYPDDVVGPIEFLLGPGSGYLTGQIIWVTGGRLMP